MKTLISILAILSLASCAHTPARDRTQVVSIKPNVSNVSKPVAETRKAVESASGQIAKARESTETARVIAAKTVEAAKISAELDKVELNLTATQEELTSALAHNQEAETAVAVLASQIEQQAVELRIVADQRNLLAEEKRAVEISAAAGRTRERILWQIVCAFGVLVLVEGAAIYHLLRGRFLL